MEHSFRDYFRQFKLDFEPADLDLNYENSEYCLIQPNGRAATNGGTLFSHPSEPLVRLLLTSLQSAAGSSQEPLSAPVLFGFARDVVQRAGDPFLAQWAQVLEEDPFVRMKVSGKVSVTPFGPEDPLFSFAISTLASITQAVNGFASKVMSETTFEEEEKHPFDEVLKLSYDRFSMDQKAVVQAIISEYNAGIVMSLLLVLEEISPAEFAQGLIALRQQPREAYHDILSGSATALSYLDKTFSRKPAGKPSLVMIQEGEGDSIEFKSTLRWDIRQAKNNPAIERAVLKTIAAFINARGGTLFIGVRDDGSVEGIETDKFANDDKFLLHLWNLIRACLGTEFSPFIRSTLEKYEGLTICRVDCQPATRPAFLRQPGFPEELYVRVGPSSNALEISDALAYVTDRFQ